MMTILLHAMSPADTAKTDTGETEVAQDIVFEFRYTQVKSTDDGFSTIPMAMGIVSYRPRKPCTLVKPQLSLPLFCKPGILNHAHRKFDTVLRIPVACTLSWRRAAKQSFHSTWWCFK